MATENNKLEEMIRTSLEHIHAMVDANTVVGTPIETPSGTTIIPISKVSVGYASGGLDFDGKHQAPPKNFAGGGGTGLSVQPVCFLAVSAEGTVEVHSLAAASTNDSVEKLVSFIDHAPDLVEKIKALLSKFKKKKKTDEGDGEITEEVVKTATEVTETVIEATEE